MHSLIYYIQEQIIDTHIQCFHCGEDCNEKSVAIQNKHFCCDGCKTVYQILNQSGLCDYYEISKNPGINQKIKVRESKFSYLDDEKVIEALTIFKEMIPPILPYIFLIYTVAVVCGFLKTYTN